MTDYCVYVGGPMTNRPNFNFPTFDAVARHCREVEGWKVFNPHEHDRETYPGIDDADATRRGDVAGITHEVGFSFKDAMSWDLRAVIAADGIVLLPEWEQSTGATHERYVAEVTGKDVWLAIPDTLRDTWLIVLDPNQVVITAKPARPKLIVGLTGPKRSGKDLAGRLLIENGLVDERISYADNVRAFALATNPLVPFPRKARLGMPAYTDHVRLSHVVADIGWERAKDEVLEVRQLLQRIGTDAARNIFGWNVWVDTALEGLDPDKRYVVTDVRFDNEAEAIRALGGEVWEIERPSYEWTGEHASERGVSKHLISRTIRNDGKQRDLRRALQSVWTPA